MPPATESRPTRKPHKTKVPRGRRKRRLRRLTAILAAIATVAIVAGIFYYRASRPETRRPGEKLDDITERLALGLPDGAPQPRFVDVTGEAGLGDFVTYVGERTSQLPEDMGAGIAWGDYDNDGDDDLFLVGAGGALDLAQEQWSESVLYENRGNGTFARHTGFPSTQVMGMGTAWGDFDNDGWLDLVVAGYGALVLFRNDNGSFAPIETLDVPPGYWSAVAWADFDRDRDLDLYVCGYVRYKEDSGEVRAASEQYGKSVPYTLNPASFDAERNLLFQNDGDGGFTEVGQLYGVSNPDGRSLGALWHDFDDDGWLDLYVANDISDNALLLNRQETFEDISLAAWVADYRGAMGLAAADWNRDGDEDLFVTHWLAQENALYDSRLVDFQRARAAEDAAAPAQLSFSDLAAPLGLGQIALHAVGWGTEFVDFDADGWLDVIVANGSTLETDEAPRGLEPQADMLMWNHQGKSFHDLAPMTDTLSQPRVSRGLALSDYDLDGDLDVAIYDLYKGVRLLRNDTQQGNWVQLRLRNRTASASAFGRGEGSVVILGVDGREVRRLVSSASYLSQSSRTVHFGFGEAPVIESLEVRWLGGEAERYEPVAVNATWELTEGDPVPRRLDSGLDSELGNDDGAAGNVAEMSERERITEFWRTQRAAMDAMKIDNDIPQATALFQRALELDPEHEDSRYYLANCLAIQGQIDQAMAHLTTLTEINPLSHRAFKQLGVMRAMVAESPQELELAAESLERSLEINQEETGALLVLGELSLMLGDLEMADERLALACRTNPKAVGGFFLRGYMAWKEGDREAAVDQLRRAAAARGEDFVPEGAVAEGDVTQRMHREASPLSLYWESWDGGLEPAKAYRPLDGFLTRAGLES